MASLIGNDIGLNYKGLINLGSSINQNISGTLQYLTDGDGNNLPLQVATGLVGVDGGTIVYTTGTNSKSVLSQTYTINSTGGTNTITGIKVNATETAIVGTTHSLLDLQVGGVTQFRVDNTGVVNKGTYKYGFFTGNFFGIYNGATLLFAVDSAKTLNGYGEFRNFGSAYIGSNSFSPQARLHIRSDGTTPIIRAEDSAGTGSFTVSTTATVLSFGASATTQAVFTASGGQLSIAATASGLYRLVIAASEYLYLGAAAILPQNGVGFNFATNPQGQTSGTYNSFGVTGSYGAVSGNANQRALTIAYTINNTGVSTGTLTGIHLNATETSLNSMTHNLIDLQVGGISKFKVDRTGFIATTATYMSFGAGNNAVGVDSGGFLYFQGANRFYVTNAGLIYGYNDLRNTGNIIAGGISISPLARLHIRGDGTNPIARFESSTATPQFIIKSGGIINMPTLPTAPAGLSAGDLWNNGGVVTVV